jgi:two-component system response regulator EvgA
MSTLDGRHGLRLLGEFKPDVLIVDMKIPSLNGFDLLDSIAAPKPVVIAISGYPDVMGAEAYRRHAHVFVRKPFEISEVVAAAKRHLADRGHLPREMLESLSAREKEVLENIAAGYSTDQIATRLGISTETVFKHRKSIKKKCKGMSFIQICKSLQGRTGIVESASTSLSPD